MRHGSLEKCTRALQIKRDLVWRAEFVFGAQGALQKVPIDGEFAGGAPLASPLSVSGCIHARLAVNATLAALALRKSVRVLVNVVLRVACGCTRRAEFCV